MLLYGSMTFPGTEFTMPGEIAGISDHQLQRDLYKQASSNLLVAFEYRDLRRHTSLSDEDHYLIRLNDNRKAWEKPKPFSKTQSEVP